MQLPLSTAALGTREFKEILTRELTEHFFEFPLDTINDDGGWPDPESITVSIERLTEAGDCIHVQVFAQFVATISSSCAPHGSGLLKQGHFFITINRHTGVGVFSDRASAAGEPCVDDTTGQSI